MFCGFQNNYLIKKDFDYFNEKGLQDPIFKVIGKNLETSKEKIKQIEDYKKDFLTS